MLALGPASAIALVPALVGGKYQSLTPDSTDPSM